ncbi:class I SAM-dependent methyltransferase [Rhodobacteraceae bacterium NNCM2]|nr:class I SAM-dependent methyltransferase [Coraliihabitans acroporae]
MTDQQQAPSPTQFFNREMAERYDERNSRLAPISDNLHFLMRLVLDDLPPRARILCIGVGTGADILALAEARPEWTFVGVDPSPEMLEVCRNKLRRADILARCDLVEGYVGQAPTGAGFDAAISLLVAHFVPRADRPGFYQGIHERLKPGGRLVSAEICGDLDSAEFPEMVADWARVQTLMGASLDWLQKLPETLRETLCVLSPTETERLMREAGFRLPIQFFQSFMIRGFHARK